MAGNLEGDSEHKPRLGSDMSRLLLRTTHGFNSQHPHSASQLTGNREVLGFWGDDTLRTEMYM